MIAAMTHRRLQAEVMDDPTLNAASHRAALRGLARLNLVSRSAAALWAPLRAALREADGPLRLLDVACGGGDVTVALARRAQRERLPLTVHGCDISDNALDVARERAAARRLDTRFFPCDVLARPLPHGYDVMTCSLFLHHLTREAATTLLASMACSAALVIVDDLRRGPVAWAAASVAARLLSRSPVVHIDAPRSVRAAFTIDEMRDLAHQAGLAGARVQPRFPVRMVLTWRRT